MAKYPLVEISNIKFEENVSNGISVHTKSQSLKRHSSFQFVKYAQNELEYDLAA
jgi:hypothetical protein